MRRKAKACARCGHQPDDPDDLGPCAGCERECCDACLDDGTCVACLAEEAPERMDSHDSPAQPNTRERHGPPKFDPKDFHIPRGYKIKPIDPNHHIGPLDVTNL